MKKLRSNGNGSGVLKSLAEKFLLARHGQLEHIPRLEVKKLVSELQLHQTRLEKQYQDLHLAKKSNSEARERYADLYDLVPVGYFTLDPQGAIINVNLTGAGMLRTEQPRLVNQPLHRWIVPEFHETWRSHFQAVFETGARQSCEIKLLPQGHLPFTVALDSHMAQVNQGQMPTCHTAMRDISARKQAESELKLRERMLDAASDSIFLHDLEGHLIYVNEAACRARGYEKDELLRKNVSELVTPEYAGQREKILKNLLATGELIFESAHLRQDGSCLPVEIHAHLIDLEDRQLILSVARDITKRKQVEEALQHERSQAQRYLDVAAVMIAVLNNQGRIILMNRKGCEILGYEEEEVVGRDWFEVVMPAAHFRRVKTVFDRVMAGDLENAAYCENAVFTKDGRERLIAFHNTVLKDQNSQITGIIFSGEDITERRQEEQARQWAEEALRLAAHKWRTTFDAIGDAVCLLDPDGRILQCNQATSNLLGKSFDEILGRGCEEMFLGSAKPSGCGPLLLMRQTLKRQEIVLQVDNRWLKVSVDPILDERGTLIGGVHLTTDITIAKNSEAALRESEARFRAIFDQAAVGVALVETSSGRFLKVNQKYCDIVGLTQEEMIGATYEAFTYPDDLQVGIENIQKLRDGLIQNFTLEKRYRHKDGSVVWVKLTISAMREIEAPSRYHIVVVEDITQRRQAEIEVRQGLAKVRQALQGTVGALANTVETKDPYTAGHQRRVAQLACAIAREIGLPPDQVEGMHVLSFLHDIGKIAVPAEILSRPGKISEIEFNLIRAHPEMGYNILKDIEFPWPVAEAVLQHHERLDGSGYPGGLTGEDIILEARILAVADVVEAMASHRPYRPAVGIEAALDEITKHQGKLFDSYVVKACVQLFKEKEFAFL